VELDAAVSSQPGDLVLDPRQLAIRLGAYTGVRALIDAIQRFLDHWNDACKPFVWVKTADEILATLHRQRSHETVH
jgi:hypothetical protein